MSAQADLYFTLDRVSNAIVDAQCGIRALGRGTLPYPHRRHLGVALAALDKAQDALFKARNDPWTPPKPPAHEQLELAA